MTSARQSDKCDGGIRGDCPNYVPGSLVHFFMKYAAKDRNEPAHKYVVAFASAKP
jgi:hypothetical protein